MRSRTRSGRSRLRWVSPFVSAWPARSCWAFARRAASVFACQRLTTCGSPAGSVSLWCFLYLRLSRRALGAFRSGRGGVLGVAVDCRVWRARAAYGASLSRRFVLGGAIGLAGVALIFWPELSATQTTDATLRGVAFTVAAVLLSGVGSLSASRNSVRGLAFWPVMGFGMLYGGGACALIALALGRSFLPPVTLSWWLSLAYLALAGSVLAFACFLSLQNRLGPGRAGTVGVMTPILALLVSLLLEGFRPSWATFVGALLALLGNWCILSPTATPKIAGASPSPPKPPRKPPS